MPTRYPDLDQLRRQAKKLLHSARSGDPHALRLLPRPDRAPQLADAQYAVAKVVGFPSWPAMVREIGSAAAGPAWPDVRTRLVLVRGGHGDSGGRFNQHGGPGLDDTGLAQAHAAAARLTAILAEDDVVPAVLSSRRQRSIDTATIIALALGVAAGEPTCDLCEMHPGPAEGLTFDEMAERYGPNYAFVPGAEPWADFVPRSVDGLARITTAHRGRTVVCVTESAVVKASFTGLVRMPMDAATTIRSDYGSITEWSCLVEGDVRRTGVWRLDRFNERPPGQP